MYLRRRDDETRGLLRGDRAGSCAASPMTIRRYVSGSLSAMSATWLAPIEKSARTMVAVSFTQAPNVFFTKAIARAMRSLLSATECHARRASSPPHPCGQTTKGYASAAMRQAGHARSGRSLPPWSATMIGRGSRAPSGTETTPSISDPSRRSISSGKPASASRSSPESTIATVATGATASWTSSPGRSRAACRAHAPATSSGVKRCARMGHESVQPFCCRPDHVPAPSRSEHRRTHCLVGSCLRERLLADEPGHRRQSRRRYLSDGDGLASHRAYATSRLAGMLPG